MRKKARQYAIDNYSGKTFNVKATNENIFVPSKGIRHGSAGKDVLKLQALLVLPELIESSRKIKVEEDRRGRPDIKAVHIYKSNLIEQGKIRDVLIFVRETEAGKKFYDHAVVKEKPVGSETTEKQLGIQPTTGSINNIQNKQPDVQEKNNKKQPDKLYQWNIDDSAEFLIDKAKADGFIYSGNELDFYAIAGAIAELDKVSVVSEKHVKEALDYLSDDYIKKVITPKEKELIKQGKSIAQKIYGL